MMQKQKRQPGQEYKMHPKPEAKKPLIERFFKLEGKIAVITGGDSGIGRAVAIAFAQEGADIAIIYLKEHRDAKETKRLVLEENRRCLLIECDVGEEKKVQQAIKKVIKEYKTIDILVNNAAEQHPQNSIREISSIQLEKTFRTNVFSCFYMVKAALPYMQEGSSIINTASVVAYRGSKHLMDYSATKGAIVAFTRALSANLVEKKIRVNAVAPGPIWTPLIVATFSKEHMKKFGKKTPMKRAGEPSEVAPSFVFLASADSSYITGQVLHPNGGEIING
jgi:NAD(P)-dependent dehydrogenase (short-subunit alcohol dehydrogenase family)